MSCMWDEAVVHGWQVNFSPRPKAARKKSLIRNNDFTYERFNKFLCSYRTQCEGNLSMIILFKY